MRASTRGPGWQRASQGGRFNRDPARVIEAKASAISLGNEGRTAESLLFDSDDWLVYVTAHERAFGSSNGLPAYLKSRAPVPGAEILRRAGALDEASLEASLGELLSPREIKAILKRRDALAAIPAGAER